MKKLHKFILLLNIPLLLHLCYFISLSSMGFLALKVVKPKPNVISTPHNLDLFFMSVSASTVSSMGTMEMEVFSNHQLWVLIFLMLFGGEAFTSMLGLEITKARLKRRTGSINLDEEFIRYRAIKYLTSVVFSYLVSFTVIGSLLVSTCMILNPTDREVLRRKGIKLSTFSIFMAVSSFMNCGFTPNNENMISFKKNSVLQLLILSIVLAGNTLFPPCLRFLLWIINKVTKCRHCSYLLQNSETIGYEHLFSYEDSANLASTVFVFVVMQVVLFCLLEWNSEPLKEMNPLQKIIGGAFQSVNVRHAGESILDLSTVSSAVLVLYIVMMYLPPYTRFQPRKLHDRPSANEEESNGGSLLPRVVSQVCVVVVFIVLVCVTERRAIVEDPLNFSVLNIVFEVVSAYGNVGFSLGYSCKRLLNPDRSCKDEWYGFVGRWSSKGKLILLLVMLFGRLKRFCMDGGKAWKLS